LKRFSRSLFVLLALVSTMGTLSFGCSKSEDDTKAVTPPAGAPVKPEGGGGAPPPKTHD